MLRAVVIAILALCTSTAVRGADAPPNPHLRALMEEGILVSSELGDADLTETAKVDGARAAAALAKLARMLEPSAPPADTLAILTRRGIIGSVEYWKKNAVPGRTCDGAKLAIIVERTASRLPVPPPPSAKAAPLRPVPFAEVTDGYDIVIAGAGTGGCGAAAQAARMGRSVLLLEETDWIGGQMNAAAVTSMDEGLAIARERGLYRELCGLIKAHYDPLGISSETAYWHRHPCVEPRVGQQLLLKMLASPAGAGGKVHLLLRAKVIRTTKVGQAITGVEIEGQGGRRRIACRVLVDATEWGDVIPLTGARYRAGMTTNETLDGTKAIQDLTWTAVVKQYPAGVPATLRLASAPPGYATWRKQFEKALTAGKPDDFNPPGKGNPWPWNWFIGYRGMPDSSRPPQGRLITRTHLNFGNDYHASVADLEDLAHRRATLDDAIGKTLCLLYHAQTALGKSDWAVADDEGYDTPYNREQADALIARRPEFAPFKASLVHLPVMAYVRESRRIIGMHTLTAREIERKPGQPIQFPNTVALGDYAVDLHGSLKPELLEPGLDRPEDIPHKFGERGLGPFAIPFECFIPETIDGFLPAEKNLSQSRMANGATRLQPHTLNMGQAVGAIAALAVAQGVQPRSVDPRQVQAVLLDAGCTLAIKPVKARWGSAEWKAQQQAELGR